MGYIKHNGKKYKSVILRVSRSTDFSVLMEQFNNMDFTGFDDNKLENIRHSLLELVNNSIRAHKERQEDAVIILRFTMTPQELIIILQDKGGGFDKKSLPYDIDLDVNDIDIKNQYLKDYREKHGYIRFGMGLFITKKAFDTFILKFTASDGSLNDRYEKGISTGTFIELRSHI
jgi:anti-sigma regulatory factor (Ser/Thr protein kinase)